jgi:quinol monooxygenase YgiN
MTPPAARMTVQWFVPQESAGAINSALNVLMVATRAQHGCANCSLSAQMGGRAGITYAEEWDTEADLISQLRSDRFAKLAQLMESATETPRVEFVVPSGVRGIDYAENVLSHTQEDP